MDSSFVATANPVVISQCVQGAEIDRPPSAAARTSPPIRPRTPATCSPATTATSDTLQTLQASGVNDNPPDFSNLALKKRSNSLPFTSDNVSSQEFNPVGLQQALLQMVENIDDISAKCNELDSRVDIIQNSIFTTLNTKIDAQIRHFRQTFDVEALLSRFNMQNKTLEESFQTQFRALKEENANIRSVWDSHMESLRDHAMSNDARNMNERDDNTNESANASTASWDFDERYDDLIGELHSLKKTMYDFDVRLIECESYPRRESLVISGVPANIQNGKPLQSTVLDILWHMGLTGLKEDDISACHRLQSPPNSRYPPRVIVRFMNRKVVDWCLSHYENINEVRNGMGLNVRFFESLSAKNVDSLKMCKSLLNDGRICKYYTRNGFVKYIAEEGDEPVRVSHPMELSEKFNV